MKKSAGSVASVIRRLEAPIGALASKEELKFEGASFKRGDDIVVVHFRHGAVKTYRGEVAVSFFSKENCERLFMVELS